MIALDICVRLQIPCMWRATLLDGVAIHKTGGSIKRGFAFQNVGRLCVYRRVVVAPYGHHRLLCVDIGVVGVRLKSMILLARKETYNITRSYVQAVS